MCVTQKDAQELLINLNIETLTIKATLSLSIVQSLLPTLYSLILFITRGVDGGSYR